MEDFDGEWRYAYYDNFEIKGESEQFKLILGSYEGTAGKCTFSKVCENVSSDTPYLSAKDLFKL